MLIVVQIMVQLQLRGEYLVFFSPPFRSLFRRFRKAFATSLRLLVDIKWQHQATKKGTWHEASPLHLHLHRYICHSYCTHIGDDDANNLRG